MTIRVIEKTIEIHAPAETVWNVLFGAETYSEWASAFSDGASVQTDWHQGSTVIFTDDSHSGLIGEIQEAVPHQRMVIRYTGVLEGGQEIYDNEEALQMKDAHETYRLSGDNEHTRLEIASDMDETYFDDMSAAWDKALLIVKELAEAN